MALLAAAAFGATTPFIARGQGSGSPVATAFLLYAGAAAAAIALRLGRQTSDARLARRHLPRLLAVAATGAAAAPIAFAWGIARTGPTAGSLLLCLEAVFTALIAWLVRREPIGPRVALALALMTAAGGLLAAGPLGERPVDLLGIGAVGLATLAWAGDNVLTRPLADVEPLSVVAGKGALGAAATLMIALVSARPWPAPGGALLLLACGATGYGLSLRFYLLAQRRIGAGRTGSVFAVAPLLGAALSFALGDRAGGASGVGAAAALFALGLYLHATERHAHHHVHEPTGHEHAHRHDDGHHGDHVHDPPVAGEHSHWHEHAAVAHSHDHAPDLHHGHGHGHTGGESRGHGTGGSNDS